MRRSGAAHNLPNPLENCLDLGRETRDVLIDRLRHSSLGSHSVVSLTDAALAACGTSGGLTGIADRERLTRARLVGSSTPCDHRVGC